METKQDVRGFCDGRFDDVRHLLAGNLASGKDLGASVAVTVEGELLVDLWGGWADQTRTKPWQSDTIVNTFSLTKTMTNLCALILADTGELDLDAPVARYWPEFATNGKEQVLVRHVLAHTAGLPGFDDVLAAEDLYDWEKVTGLLAAQAPWWQPGTAAGYHAMTQGYLVGEVVRRVTGRTLGNFFAEEVAGPLGADFHIGLSASEDFRVAELGPVGPTELPPEVSDITRRTLGPVDTSHANNEASRRAEIPAGNGHGNARSVATIQAALACGGSVGGVRLLSPAGCERVLEEQFFGVDLVLGVPLRYGMGYGLVSKDWPLSANPRACFWAGAGGSIVVADLDARMTVAYVMNRMVPGVGDPRGANIAILAGRLTDALQGHRT